MKTERRFTGYDDTLEPSRDRCLQSLMISNREGPETVPPKTERGRGPVTTTVRVSVYVWGS